MCGATVDRAMQGVGCRAERCRREGGGIVEFWLICFQLISVKMNRVGPHDAIIQLLLFEVPGIFMFGGVVCAGGVGAGAGAGAGAARVV